MGGHGPSGGLTIASALLAETFRPAVEAEVPDEGPFGTSGTWVAIQNCRQGKAGRAMIMALSAAGMALILSLSSLIRSCRPPRAVAGRNAGQVIASKLS